MKIELGVEDEHFTMVLDWNLYHVEIWVFLKNIFMEQGVEEQRSIF